MSVYIDTYFVLNLAVDYLILLATAKLRALSVRRWRLGLAALSGALYAVLALLLPGGLLALPLMLLVFAALMLLIAFGGTAGLFATALVFAGVSAAFGGFALALGLLLGRLRIDLGILLLSVPLCWIVLKLAFSRKAAAMPERIWVDISQGEAHVRMQALGDSGNLLQDPISGDRVLVAEAKALLPLFSGELASALGRDFSPHELLQISGEIRFRLVPYSSVEGKGLLAAFRPEKIQVAGKVRRDILVAVAPGKMSDTDAFQAILGGAL